MSELLRAAGEMDVMLSCENFALLLFMFDSPDRALRFLDSVRKTTRITFIWTLRRFDDFRRSLYLQFVSIGYVPSSPEKFMSNDNGERLFSGMLALESRVDDVVYLKYDPGGSHNDLILRALSLPAHLADELRAEVAGDSQLNPSLSHKQAEGRSRVDPPEPQPLLGRHPVAVLLMQVWAQQLLHLTEPRCT